MPTKYWLIITKCVAASHLPDIYTVDQPSFLFIPDQYSVNKYCAMLKGRPTSENSLSPEREENATVHAASVLPHRLEQSATTSAQR